MLSTILRTMESGGEGEERRRKRETAEDNDVESHLLLQRENRLRSPVDGGGEEGKPPNRACPGVFPNEGVEPSLGERDKVNVSDYVISNPAHPLFFPPVGKKNKRGGDVRVKPSHSPIDQRL